MTASSTASLPQCFIMLVLSPTLFLIKLRTLSRSESSSASSERKSTHHVSSIPTPGKLFSTSRRAFEQLRESIKYYDNLIYAEPWGWMQPPRHAYAALQLEQGNVEEAAKTYAEDLGFSDSLPRAVRHPNNVWALHGYHECLVKLARHDEAKILEPQLTLALAVADISIESSCFCRRVQPAANQSMCCKS